MQVLPIATQNPFLSHQGTPRFAASVRQKALPEGGKVEVYKDIVILGGARTPFAKSGTSLQNVTVADLMKIAAKGALEKIGIKSEDVSQLIMGNIIVNDEQSSFVPRQVAKTLGLKEGTIASLSNRVCGTGFEVIRQAAHELVNGGDSIILTGGGENMSQAPIMDAQTYKAAKANPPGQPKPHNYNPLVKSLTDQAIGMVMFETADKLASRYQVSRDEADTFAASSHQKSAQAIQQGAFQQELVPVRKADLSPQSTLPDGITEVAEDQGVLRPGTTAQTLGGLRVMNQKQPDAIHTPGSSSAVVDGAAVTVVSTGKLARKKGLPVLAYVKAMAVTGCDPREMGIGPARAIQEVLKASRLKLDNIDVIEINEAFAGQALSVAKEVSGKTNYDYNRFLSKLNPDGGAIAIGHPLAASGSRITLHTALRMKEKNQQYAIVSACIGGGQGIAALIENPDVKKS